MSGSTSIGWPAYQQGKGLFALLGRGLLRQQGALPPVRGRPAAVVCVWRSLLTIRGRLAMGLGPKFQITLIFLFFEL